MELDSIKYQTLIDMGFERQEVADDVCFRQTGYYGFNLWVEFPLINIGISSPCIAQTDGQKWDFQLYKIDTANVIRKIKLNELKSLIEFFTLKSSEVADVIIDVEGVQS